MTYIIIVLLLILGVSSFFILKKKKESKDKSYSEVSEVLPPGGTEDFDK
jgi:hypothetical protein